MAETRALRGLGAIGHPVALVALGLLVLNDTVLKAVGPGLVTGKLSDVAGLVVLPLVVATLLATVLDDDDLVIRVAVTSIGAWFAAMKTIPAVAGWTEKLAELVVPHASIVVDPTDLVALPALGLAVWTWRRRLPPHVWLIPLLLLAAVWSMATSCLGPAVPSAVHVSDDGSFLVETDWSDEAVRIDPHGRLVDRDVIAADLPTRQTEREVCLADGTCVQADGHDVVEVAPDGSRTRAVDIPESRFAYARHRGAGDCGGDLSGVRDVVANESGVVVVAHGSHGISVRAATGTWGRLPVRQAPLTGTETPPNLHFAVWSTTLVGFLLATWPASHRQAWFSAAGVAAGALAAVLGGSPVLGLLDSLPSLGTAMALAAATPQLVRPREDAAGSHLRWVAVSFVAVGIVSEVIAFAWARGWIEHFAVAAVLVVVASLGTALAWAVRARPEGLWPAPPGTTSPDPPHRGTDAEV